MDKIKNIFKGNFAYFLTFFIILLFPLCAYYLLVKKEFITKEAFFGNVLGFAGWIIALLIAWIYIRKNREDNLIIQNNEIKKRLEIETFKEINKMIVKNEDALADISTFYTSTLKNKIRAKIINSNANEIVLARNGLENIYLEVREQNTNLIDAWKNFIISIEAYEIVLIRFNELKDVLNKEFRKILIVVDDFEDYILKITRKKSLERKTDLDVLDQKILKINENLMDLACYLSDYRTELMNLALGDIFHSKIPKRKVKEPYKTLTQIAKETYKDS